MSTSENHHHVTNATMTTTTTTTSITSTSNGSVVGVGQHNGIVPSALVHLTSNGKSAGGGAASDHDVWADGQPRSFRRSDYIRLLMQSLVSLGYSTSAGMLESESGIKLHSDCVAEFRQAILDGHWSMATTLLARMELQSVEKRKKVEFLILRQQYLELLERSDTVEALNCLRTRIAVLAQDPDAVHKLSSLLVCGSPSELRQIAQWEGTGPQSRAKLLSDLQGLISPSLLIPERRLETLVDQALQFQSARCHYHSRSNQPLPLFHDLTTESNYPQYTTEILEGHSDEVWFVAFSHSGARLASGSKDKTLILWNFTTHIAWRLEGHSDAVIFLAWSPSDDKILSCSNDNRIKLWDTTLHKCERTFTKHTSPPLACAWLNDGDRFVSGATDKHIYMWSSVTGNVLMQWSDIRVNDLAISADGRRMVVVCTERLIHVYDLGDHSKMCIEEADNLRSCHLSQDGRYLLVNVATQDVHEWDLEEQEMKHQYKGLQQKHYVIRSTFGGVRQDLVASGSEDSQVYLWNRQSGKLLAALAGHAGTISAVAWDPADPFRFASASDDTTVRVWGNDKPDPDQRPLTWSILP